MADAIQGSTAQHTTTYTCPVAARKVFSRFTVATATVRHGSKLFREYVTDEGLLLSGKGFAFPRFPLAENYNRVLKNRLVKCIPPGSGILIQPGAQRLFAKHITLDDNDLTTLLINVSKSSNRDRVRLTNGMKFKVIGQNGYCILSFEIPESLASTVTDQHDDVLSSDGSFSTVDTGSSPMKLESTTEKLGSFTAGIPSDNRASPRLLVFIDGEQVATLDSNCKSVCLIGQNQEPLNKEFIRLPFDTALPQAVINFDLYDGYLLLPRENKDSDSKIYIFVPKMTNFPLIDGDILTIVMANESEMDISIEFPDIAQRPSPSKSVLMSLFLPKRDATRVIRDIAIEVLKQKGTSAEDKVYVFYRKYFKHPDTGTVRIGRSDCTIYVPDKHISKHHATIVLDPKLNTFVLYPEGDNRPVSVLIGKDDSHYRPLFALQQGHVFTTGKTDFKVVYLSAGNEDMTTPTVHDELKEKMSTSCRRPCKLTPQNPDSAKIENNAVSDTNADLFDSFSAVIAHFGQQSIHATGPVMILKVVRGPNKGAFFSCFSTETTIGSGKSADISIPFDSKMSRLHARVLFDKVKRCWQLEDSGSHHGTTIQVNKLNGAITLRVGDELLMGATRFKVLGNYF